MVPEVSLDVLEVLQSGDLLDRHIQAFCDVGPVPLRVLPARVQQRGVAEDCFIGLGRPLRESEHAATSKAIFPNDLAPRRRRLAGGGHVRQLIDHQHIAAPAADPDPGQFAERLEVLRRERPDVAEAQGLRQLAA